jgi:hypothetical protein
MEFSRSCPCFQGNCGSRYALPCNSGLRCSCVVAAREIFTDSSVPCQHETHEARPLPGGIRPSADGESLRDWIAERASCMGPGIVRDLAAIADRIDAAAEDYRHSLPGETAFFIEPEATNA